MAKPKLRRIKRAKISHISLCPRGVNQMPVVFKADGKFTLQTIAKLDDEGVLTAVVYAPDRGDSEGDFASVEAIRAMCHGFIGEGANIDIRHNLKPVGKEQVSVCENFIVQKGDARFAAWKDTAGQPVDVVGSWAVILKLHDPDLRQLYRDGEWNGVSMYGHADVELVDKEKVTSMDPEELKRLLKEQHEALLVALTKAVTPTPPQVPVPAPAPTPESIPFEGDPTSLEDLAKHEELVLFKSLDLSKPADILKWRNHLTAKKAAETPPADAQKVALEAAQAEVARLLKASNQPVPDGKPEENPLPEGSLLTKEEWANHKLGKRMAAALNKQNGRG